ncbi:MAG: PEGA domain-containing protein [Planctomycetes bacterium]|nr:PEGA domain-containing protein [Planctomycetota bacterium]
MKRLLGFILIVIITVAVAIGTFAIRKYIANPGDGHAGPANLTLSVSSTPDASVYLNGVFRGLTPIEINELHAGMHALRLDRDGYQPYQQAVNLEASQKLEISLAVSPKCSLTVNSTPDGALVFLDGTQHGRTPYKFDDLKAGEHYLKLVKTNYFPATRTLVLVEEEPQEANFELKNRFVQAYRSALEENPYNLAAYNDLGEQLYVLGRYEEAAQVYVQGLIAASPPFKENITSRNDADRRQLLKEPRNKVKHPDKKFEEALNQAVFAAMREGSKADCLLDDFKQALPRGRYPEEAVQAMDRLLEKNPGDIDLVISLIPFYNQLNANTRLLELFDVVMGSVETEFDKQMSFAELVLGILDKDMNYLLLEKLEGYLARIEPSEKSAYQSAYFKYISGWLAFVKNNPSEGILLWQEAIEQQGNVHIADNWRLALVEHYQKVENFAAAAKILYTILESPNRNSPSYRKAQQIERKLPKKYQKDYR